MPSRRDDELARFRQRSGRPGSVPNRPPYDFGTDDEGRADPVEMMGIRSDDELLSALAAGFPIGAPTRPDGDPGYRDEQHLLAMLNSLRDEVDSEPFPELVSVDEACAAIAAGRPPARPRRRLMPVAVAAAVVVFGLSGVAIASTNAQPGDPLWGVSQVVDGGRAQSVLAAYQVNQALDSAQQALKDGHPNKAQQIIEKVKPRLSQIHDTQRKNELSRKSANLLDAAAGASEGESVDTDSDGAPRDRDNSGREHHRGPNPSTQPSEKANPPADARSNQPGSGGPSGPVGPGGQGGPGQDARGTHQTGGQPPAPQRSGQPTDQPNPGRRQGGGPGPTKTDNGNGTGGAQGKNGAQNGAGRNNGGEQDTQGKGQASHREERGSSGDSRSDRGGDNDRRNNHDERGGGGNGHQHGGRSSMNSSTGGGTTAPPAVANRPSGSGELSS